MTKKISTLVILLVSIFLFQCSSDPDIEPQQLGEDPTTSAASYADQFLTIEVTNRFIPTGVEEDDWYPHFQIRLYGNGGNVSVNWGDGTIHKMQVNAEGLELRHDYQALKNYKIVVSGDIKTITGFDAIGTSAKVNAIHFGGLVNLKSVMLAWVDSPEIINLSRNRQLENVVLTLLRGTKDILLPATNAITHIEVTDIKDASENSLSTAVVDRLVSRIYDSVKSSSRAGVFDLKADVTQGNANPNMVGNPSSYTFNKLRTLRDTYGWSVYPTSF